MDQLAYVEDILPLLAFSAAVILVLRIPSGDGEVFSRGAKWFLTASAVVYFVGTLWSVLNRTLAVPQGWQELVYSVELLWAPFILFALYSLYARQELLDARAALAEVQGTGDMMERVVDAAPAGIVVIDRVGLITFANETARALLGLEEDPGRLAVQTPGWTVHISEQGSSPIADREDLRGLLAPEPMADVAVVVEWPDGARRRLVVNTTPTVSGEGVVTGAVVAFVEREPWLRRSPKEDRLEATDR